MRIKLPLDLKIYIAFLIVANLLGLLLSAHATMAVTPLGVFAVGGWGAYTYILVMRLGLLLAAILIFLKLHFGWYAVFCHRVYALISFTGILMLNFRGVFESSATLPVYGYGIETSAFAQKLFWTSFIVSLVIAFLEVIYLLWRRKHFFDVCRAAKSERSVAS